MLLPRVLKAYTCEQCALQGEAVLVAAANGEALPALWSDSGKLEGPVRKGKRSAPLWDTSADAPLVAAAPQVRLRLFGGVQMRAGASEQNVAAARLVPPQLQSWHGQDCICGAMQSALPLLSCALSQRSSAQ